MTSGPFRITPAPPETLRRIEQQAPPELKAHFDLIKKGLEAIPGVPGEAVYGAVTLRTLALQPPLFQTWFLTEYFSVKEGEIPTAVKELLAAVISWRNEGDETPACAPYHTGAARFEGASEDALSVVSDYEANRDRLPAEHRAIIDLGLKAAFAPREVTTDDVEAVRDHGYSDAALVELVSAALIAYNLSALNQVFDLREGGG